MTDSTAPISTDSVPHLKPPVDPATLAYRDLRRDEFWRKIPAWKDIDTETFGDYSWQDRNAITNIKKLINTVQDLAPASFIEDVQQGFAHAPMAMRIPPYILSLIDWERPENDPIRLQFMPIASEAEPDHPMLTLDSLHEQADAPVRGLTHRYPDKALFLALDTCPIYCRFCTRSYAVGLDTDLVEKVHIRADDSRWRQAFQYIRERPELEDIVISGGDSYRLKPEQIREIGHALIDIPHVRRFRYATKGLAVVPMRIKAGDPWTEAVTEVAERARKLGKDVVIHTHFNHPNEATGFSEDALRVLFERGIFVRNQSVLQRRVNDSVATQVTLAKRLSHINIHPYYVYVHDLVRGVEVLRTTVQTAVDLEKHVRGSLAGFNTPTFVVDAMGGGGKRIVHSFEHYDRETGVSIYGAPSVKKDQLFTYFDPMTALKPEIQAAWRDEAKRTQMIEDAKATARRKLAGG